ncbi:RNA helicase [Ktedonobacteria bacterium brp13]|nr:RNA helicase [Ktedonobacteria bacterium brp13]
MNTIFDFRDQLIDDYASYVNSFLQIRDLAIQAYVQQQMEEGALWPEPLIQLNPLFEQGEYIDALVAERVLHPECARIFRKGKSEDDGQGLPLRLHRHQSEAVRMARSGASYVLTTGTGSGKSLSYILPIVDHVLRTGSGRGIQAIVCYPMNALANSQLIELQKFLQWGYPEGASPVTFARYTGQEKGEERNAIIAQPPDILLTNYVMLELILTRAAEQKLLANAQLRFLVLDELHTYRGRQGADVALLVRRVRNRLGAGELQCIGTSATLAGSGSYEERQAGVARMATQIFGTTVGSEQIIGETLRPVTRSVENDETFRQQLTKRVLSAAQPPSDYQGFLHDPLSIWIERTFGITERDGRVERTTPKSISGERGAAHELSATTGTAFERCVEAIQRTLLAGYECEPIPETDRPPFAFRLHQFITKGDTLYASLESAGKRYLTLNGQRFVPDGQRERILLPLVFCRECGQEYYCVRINEGRLVPRVLNDQAQEEGQSGFLFYSQDNPWPDHDEEKLVERLPEDWIEEFKNTYRVRLPRKKDLPITLRVHLDGKFGEGNSGPGVDGDGLTCQFVSAPFRFCLHCGVSYNARQRLDFGKLAALSSEGRSTATTILSLSAIRYLREKPQEDIPAKLLSFTDNRQDASLQAGHFNDFIEVGILRSALYRAVLEAGAEGLRHDTLMLKVFDALALPFDQYASDPGVKYQAFNDTQQAFRNVLGYRLYCDLRRGWRITSPNLEQTGLLNIRYLSLDEVCQDEDVWRSCHETLSGATPATRERIGKVLLDYMRRELAIKVDSLDSLYQDRLRNQSSQRLAAPWGLDENETMTHAAILFPRSRSTSTGDYGGNVYLSARGGFGQYLRRTTTFKEFRGKLTLKDTEQIIKELLEGLRKAGLVEQVQEAAKKEKDAVPGYQLPASALIWKVGDGTQVFYDPIRTPRESSEGHRPNTFFVDFYRGMSAKLNDLRAYEHTAQVPSDLRQKREDEFRANTLPILYCSPTMELGVDISELNLVHLRNIPPTPANYAQRSGRAGRSGQPALVISYCSTGSPHDQYFFKRPEQMVAGSVTPPRLDLANEDLVRAHVHAIWLAETGLSLGSSLPDLLNIAAENLELPLFDWVRISVEDDAARKRALRRAKDVLATLQEDLLQADWYKDEWLDRVLDHVALSFERTTGRWRELYRSARRQIDIQHKIRNDPARSPEDRERAERLRDEAEAQEKLLTDSSTLEQSDFYSYRYFASEGFLPGYNFPRLPLSAYIPGRRARQQDRNEYLSRPRFLAISEFGPRAIVYHEGSRYEINRVILSVESGENLATSGVKQCENCGYLHPLSDDGVGLDVCEHCGARLGLPLRHLFRLQNVATRRRDRINSDEEERTRLGYDIRTAVRFDKHESSSPMRMGQAHAEGKPEENLATLTYGHGATLWRINLGWMRRKDQSTHGFLLDVERGTWEKNEQSTDEADETMSPRVTRVIPYVEDRRNCLLFEPGKQLNIAQMASLQAALKNAIQVRYQLEDNELAAEPLPDMASRRQLLFYESSEGGAGVLRRLIDDPQALREVAQKALELCHFDPTTGEDLRRAPRAHEDCEAACYNCLLTYSNQRDHQSLDRRSIRDYLLSLARTQVVASANATPRPQHFEQLQRLTDSSLEQQWLNHLETHGHLLPTKAQQLIPECQTRPDFCYEDAMVAIYIDGPYHDFPERHARDATTTECLEDRGYLVIRFGHQDDWDAIIAQYPSTFGRHA